MESAERVKKMSEKDKETREELETAAEEKADATLDESSSDETATAQTATEPEADGAGTDTVEAGEAGEAEAEEAEVVEAEAEAEAEGETETEAEQAETEEPKDTGPPKRWYVVHTYSGHENKVKDNIQKMINTSGIQPHFGQIIVPTEEVAEMKKGKKTVATRKFFPSYILIEMHMSDEARHLVSDIPGVTSFVGTTSGPQPLSVAEVERILGRMDKEKQTIIPEIPFTLGEHIRIKDGPFSDFTGVIDEINAERGKLKVLVSIFGRETPVELDFLQVENL
jgi:transcriptional antiterminator NusG